MGPTLIALRRIFLPVELKFSVDFSKSKAQEILDMAVWLASSQPANGDVIHRQGIRNGVKGGPEIALVRSKQCRKLRGANRREGPATTRRAGDAVEFQGSTTRLRQTSH